MNEVIIETIKTASVSVPMWELTVAFLAVALCMLFRFNQMGLIIAYIFTFHLGWAYCNQELLTRQDPAIENFVFAYLVCGALVLLLTIIGMVWRPAESD